jgi:hypothetical protein
MLVNRTKFFITAGFVVYTLITTAQTGKLPEEKVVLTTDRTIYFAGEQLGLRADCILPSVNDSLSRVMYIELLDKKAKPVIQKKLQIINGISKALLEIPSDILTGNYYARAYTQYMRNFDKKQFYTTELTIINPDLPAKDVIQAIVKDTTAPVTNSDAIGIHVPSTVFQTNSPVEIELTGKNNTRVSVSVIRKGSYDRSAVGVNNYYKSSKDSSLGLKWFPEIRSVSISGKLLDKQTQRPLKQVMLYASIIDSVKQFHAAKTNEEGAFVFSLINLHDDHQVYIGADEDATILVNPDFAAGLPSADYTDMKLDSAKLALINEMYVNEQVSTIYKDENATVKTYLDTLPDPFKGSMEIVYFKDYVALPNMTDMFNEIVPYTKVKTRKGKTYIQLADKTDKSFFDHSLVLLDNIPFHNHATLLNIPPSKINSVGVIPRPYVYGGQIINGVISIKSKDGNLAGLPLPEDIVVVDYITYHPEEKIIYTKENKSPTEKPGFKNTLYWNPEVELKDGRQLIQFYSGGYLADYDVVIRGLDEKGNAFTEIKSLQVRNRIN